MFDAQHANPYRSPGCASSEVPPLIALYWLPSLSEWAFVHVATVSTPALRRRKVWDSEQMSAFSAAQ
jgi:hypothetical protein